MRNNMKKFISALVAILLVSCTVISASAATLYMDNDAYPQVGHLILIAII